MEAAPDASWRLLIALSRFGGLRIPSEVRELRWSDIDWDNRSMRIRSPKTERHEGGDVRTVPIFEELVRPLMDAFDVAREGEEYVVSELRSITNVNPQLRRIIERAGLEPWPRAWHNLRASRQTELVREYPINTACAWIGNSKLIASGHYLQTTDADWERAVGGSIPVDKSVYISAQNPSMRASARNCTDDTDRPNSSMARQNPHADAHPCSQVQRSSMGTPGLEPGTPAFSMPCSTN